MKCNTICTTERINTAYGKKEHFPLTFDSTAEIRIYPHPEFKLKTNLKQLGFVKQIVEFVYDHCTFHDGLTL